MFFLHPHTEMLKQRFTFFSARVAGQVRWNGSFKFHVYHWAFQNAFLVWALAVLQI